MHFTTLMVPVLAAVSSALAQDTLPAGLSRAIQYRSPAEASLDKRTDVDPSLVCGDNYNDCGNGWCCSASQSCAGTLEGVPVCNDPTYTIGDLKGTAVATPYQNLESIEASLSAVLTQFGGDATATAAATTLASSAASSAASSKASSTASTAAGSKATGSSSGTQAAAQSTGAAAMVGVQAFGAGIGSVVAIWVAAGLGGAGWFLMG